MENKVRFILGVVKGEIIVSNRKRADLLLELQQKGFTPFPKNISAVVAGAVDDAEEPEESIDETEANPKSVQASDYEYLLSMPIGTLTLEKVQKLCDDKDKINEEVETLRKTTPKDLWMTDLDAFESQLEVWNKSTLFTCQPLFTCFDFQLLFCHFIIPFSLMFGYKLRNLKPKKGRKDRSQQVK